MIHWLRLARISALPSAISNILLGFLLVRGDWTPWPLLLLLILSSSALYTAGMILNDVFDVEIDSVQRPQRPIPSGHISKRQATLAGTGLIVLGIAAASIAAWQQESTTIARWFPVGIAIILSCCVLAYDGILKQTCFAPILMGGCRTLNILLGASAMDDRLVSQYTICGFPTLVWWVAISIGLFVTGLTWLGRNEAADKNNRFPLIGGGILITCGLIGISFVSVFFSQTLPISNQLSSMFPLLIGLMALPVIRGVISAIVSLRPASIQHAVVTCLRSMILFDAALCFLLAPAQPLFAVAVASLMPISIWLGRSISST